MTETARGIKFRVWDKESRHWIPSSSIARVIYPFEDCHWKDDHQYILLQFTGLRDKRGREIYEGDFIATKDRDVIFEVVVDWSTDSNTYGWCYKCRKNRWAADSTKNLEVIGNMFESSELSK